MVRVPARIVALGVFSLPMVMMLATGVPPADAAACHFVLGFKALHAMAPSAIGACLGNEQHNPINGDALQRTKKGMLVWRKADNQVAFTDGYSTILEGPEGLEERLNTQRFAWEADPEGLPLAPDTPFVAHRPRRGRTIRSTPTPVTCPAAAPKTRAHRPSRRAAKKATSRPGRTRRRTTCPAS